METGGGIVDVLIVGAGISGIGMAAHLKDQCPGKSFAILDRREQPGGTWDLFRYPGIRSDSDMFTLGFAFEPWREDRAIAAGDTILNYLQRVVQSRGLDRHMQFGRKVVSANWDSAAALWTLALEHGDGSTSTAQARFLFLGSGYYDYDDPHQAGIPGLDQFGGVTVHPQFWPQDLDCTGKAVVVIGSGATAVSLVPALAGTGPGKAAHVTMLQRTPTWYIQRPAKDRLANVLRRLLPEKWAYALIRARNVRMQDFLFRRCRSAPEAMRGWLSGQVEAALGPAYRAPDFTPPYAPWDQRLCLVPDGDMFAAIRAGDASVVTGTIKAVAADAIELDDGRRIAADVIVTATGLKLAVAGKIAVSVDGTAVNFADHYYYRDCMFSNVPNFAALFGYLNAGWTLRVDIVADWLCRLFSHMDKWDMAVVRPHLPDTHGLREDPIFDAFSSGYLQRDKHRVPKSATTAPWQLSMDYLTDREALRSAPIDDGVLTFSRMPGDTLVQAAPLT
jgi:cation diffusion facilitator CzcD-associated flavoprotein CzcO